MALLERGILQQGPLLKSVGSEHFTAAEIPQFSSYALRRLEFEGTKDVYTLTGKSLKGLAENRLTEHKIWAIGDKNHPGYGQSVESFQVAINPSKLFIPNSDNKTAEEQEKVTLKYSDNIRIPGVKAIMLEPSHILDLLLQHWQKTGEHLLGEEYEYKFGRGRADRKDNSSTSIGCFSKALGLRVRKDPDNFKSPHIIALRVLVPDIVASSFY